MPPQNTTTRICQQCGRAIQGSGTRFCSHDCASAARRTRLERTCEECGSVFRARLSVVAHGGGKFCSWACRQTAQGRIQRSCAHCGQSFMAFPHAIQRGSGRYCSQHCVMSSRTGERHPRWRGRAVTPQGYTLIRMPDHPSATKSGYVREHRLVMEQHIGRRLLPVEIVHHRDGNPGNNAIDNLEIVTRARHMRIHHLGEKSTGRWARDHDCCVRCGMTDRIHAGHGLCRRCSDHDSYIRRKSA